MTILFSVLANHQIRRQATHNVGFVAQEKILGITTDKTWRYTNKQRPKEQFGLSKYRNCLPQNAHHFQ